MKRQKIEQAVKFDFAKDNEKMQMTGTAVTFGEKNRNGFRLESDSFEATNFGENIPVYYEHDKHKKLGTAILSKQDDKITFEIKLNAEINDAKEAWSHVKFGTTSAVSVGMVGTIQRHYDKEWDLIEKTVSNAEIYELSLVDRPADKTAKIEILQTEGGTNMPKSTKEVLNKLNNLNTITPEEVADIKQSFESDKETQNKKVIKLSEKLKVESNPETAELSATDLETLKTDHDNANVLLSQINDGLAKIEKFENNQIEERAKILQGFAFDQHQRTPSNVLTNAKAETMKFADNLRNLIKSSRETIEQAANNNATLSLGIPETYADEILLDAKKRNTTMWALMGLSSKKAGEFKKFLISNVTYNKQSGKYMNNVQPAESKTTTSTMLIELGTIATYIELNEMQINGTNEELLKAFKSQVMEYLENSLDTDILNHQEFADGVYTGFQGIATTQSVALGLTIESQYATVPTFNEFVKTETNRIGMFTHIWTTEAQFNEWAYEEDTLGRPLHQVQYDGDTPVIKGKRFRFNEAFSAFDDSSEVSKPFAICLTPSNYSITPPVKGTLFSVVDRQDPDNWRQRQQAMFVDGLGTLTKKAKTSAAFGGGVEPVAQNASVPVLVNEAQLKEIATSLEIDGANEMTKAQLIEAIETLTELQNIHTMTYAELITALEANGITV